MGGQEPMGAAHGGLPANVFALKKDFRDDYLAII
jgi:hypothetical protein